MSELAERYFEKALTAVRHRDYDRAAGLLVEAIKLKPDFAEAHVVRGNCLHAMDRPYDALLNFDRALNFNDRLQDAWNNRGIAFADLGLWLSAEESFRKSAELLESMEPHMGLANMFCTLNRLEDAAAEYRRAIAGGAGPDARFNLGVTLLGLGRWGEGFREYEYRWQNTPYPPRAYRNYHKWQGEDLAGKRILLYPEQGYGDEIMALRFASTVAARYPDAAVVVQARSPIYRLACCSFGPDIAVVDAHADELGIAFDYSCPLLDVPMVLGLSWQDQQHVALDSYLRPAVGGSREWRSRLLQLPPGLNVGLCWSSGGHLNTARAAKMAKSIPIQWLKPLAMPGVNLISLQKPREPVPPDFPLTDWTDDIHDFAGTAGLVDCLDLVISVDTAVAHIAGALGKPVWNFVRYSGYWPWLAADVPATPETSIWYPSMRLLRQPSLANWDEPIQRATGWLSALLGEQVAA